MPHRIVVQFPSSCMNRPLAISRQDHIVKALDASGAVSVSLLAERLGVSRETIRRDLKALADQGRANIVHGGAARGATAEPSLAARQAANASGKAAIGRKAASFVEEGMVVILDSGSTTLALAYALLERKDITVLTNSLPIALLLCRSPGVKVTMLGGEIDPNDEAAFGLDTLATLEHFRVDLAFIGVGGISPEGEPTDYSRLASEQRHIMMKAGQKVFLLVDHSKFERRTPVKMLVVPRIAGLIVDKPPPKRIAQAFMGRRWPVIQARA
ncbi:MAG: DeoR/GlpR transcriptional regulator [Hyphomicrobiales bacterium]|nr:DeoR/GlpR transcriptional regulator [Hyphomicrobiales bacterium]